jgi:hypothetical protein
MTARPRVDVLGLGWWLYGLADGRLTFDMGESLSSGAAVFRADRSIRHRGVSVNGLTVSRSIFLGSLGLRSTSDAETLAHERVHLLQQDFSLIAWSDPLSVTVLDRLPWRLPNTFVTVDGVGLWLHKVRNLVYGPADVNKSPPELEASFLSQR